MYPDKCSVTCVPQSLAMDFTRILNKPFYVTTETWKTTDVSGKLLLKLDIPGDIFTNALARVPFESSTLYRCKIKLLIQVSGTPMHQGTLLAAAMPIGFTGTNLHSDYKPLINSYLCAPHVFLSANESTSVALEIPFYVNSQLAKTDIDGTTINHLFSKSNYCEVVMHVLNQLVAPTSGSTSLSLSFYAVFTDMEFYGPHYDVPFAAPPTFQAQGFLSDLQTAGTKAIDSTFTTVRELGGDFLDSFRRLIRKYTGLHNPNNPLITQRAVITYRQNQNIVDQPTKYEKLDPYANFDRICKEPIFDTTRDEMDMLEILSKPQYLGTFVVNSTATTGTPLWSRPISPFQQADTLKYDDITFGELETTTYGNLLQNFYTISKYWRGTIKIHIQSVMSNFHFTKLTLARDYSVRTGSFDGIPVYSGVSNLLTETMEFSAGGQIQTVELPFVSPLNQLPCERDWDFITSCLGMYYIYLSQPLVTNGSVASSVQFNVYFSAGEDFQYYGYATNPLTLWYPIITETAPSLAKETTDSEEFKAQASAATTINDQKDVTFEHKEEQKDTINSLDFRPIVNVRDYLRRMYLVKTDKINVDTDFEKQGIKVYDVAELLGQRSNLWLYYTPPDYVIGSSNVLGLLSKSFLGCAGGAKFKIIINGCINSCVWYIPPSYAINEVTAQDSIWTGSVPYVEGANVEANTFMSSIYKNIGRQVNGIVDDFRFACQSVGLEYPNAHRASSTNISYPGGNLYETASMFEFEIPNMSPYKFVGDASKFGSVLTNQSGLTASSNMGHIVIFAPPAVASSTLTRDLSFSIYAGFDDSTRLGFQVACPNITIPLAPLNLTPGPSPTYQNFVQAGTTYSAYGYVSPEPTNPNPACFYTKTV